MPDALSPETEAKLRGLCDEIAAAHGLDNDLRERLGMRTTERARAYLRSDENMDEDDAYVLVREDLRDRRLGKRILGHLRVEHVPVSVGRRLAAAVVATMVVRIVVSMFAKGLAAALFVALAPPYGVGGPAGAVYLLQHALVSLGTPVLLVRTLWHWQRELERGRTPWFVRWPATTTCAAAVLLALCVQLGPQVVYAQGQAASSFFTSVFRTLGPLYALLECMAWLWWCDRPPRKGSAVRYAFAAWAGWQVIWCALSAVCPHIMLFISHGAAAPLPAGLTLLAHGAFLGGPFKYDLVVFAQQGMHVWLAYGRYLVPMTLFPGLVGCLMYVAVRRIRERNTPPVELDFPWVR